jgi:hypothetical protein
MLARIASWLATVATIVAAVSSHPYAPASVLRSASDVVSVEAVRFQPPPFNASQYHYGPTYVTPDSMYLRRMGLSTATLLSLVGAIKAQPSELGAKLAARHSAVQGGLSIGTVNAAADGAGRREGTVLSPSRHPAGAKSRAYVCL